MKKCYLFLLLLAPVLFGTANPVAPSCPVINELLWDENGNWKLEINFEHFYVIEVDSLVLTSTMGKHVFVGEFPENGLWLLTIDSIGEGFDISRDGDNLLLKIYSYHYIYPDSSFLAFGTAENAVVPVPENGKSISLLPIIKPCYAIDNSPTLGLDNDLDGVFGTISGKVYYSTGNPVISRTDLALNVHFQTDASGNYSTYVHQGTFQLSEIAKYVTWEGYFWYSIEPVSLTIEEGQTYENVDIRVSDTKFVGINDKKEPQLFKIYPNPAYKKLTLEMSTRVQGQELEIRVLDFTGKEISRYLRPVAELQELELNESLPAAMYLFEFRVDNKLVQTERILVNSFK